MKLWRKGQNEKPAGHQKIGTFGTNLSNDEGGVITERVVFAVLIHAKGNFRVAMARGRRDQRKARAYCSPSPRFSMLALNTASHIKC